MNSSIEIAVSALGEAMRKEARASKAKVAEAEKRYNTLVAGLCALASKLPAPANDRDEPPITRTSAAKKRPLSLPDEVFLNALTQDWITAGNLWRLLTKCGIAIGEGTVYNRMRKLAADYPDEVEATDKPERWRRKITVRTQGDEKTETVKVARQRNRHDAKPRLRLVSSASAVAHDNGTEALKPCVSISDTPECKIFRGDCLEVMKSMPSGSVDLIVTSPPYNLGFLKRRGMKDSSKSSRWHNGKLLDGYSSHDDAMPHDEYVEWIRKVLHECWRLLPDDGAIFLNHIAAEAAGEAA